MSLTSLVELAASPSGSKEPGCEPSRSVKSSRSPAPSSQSIGLVSPATTTLEFSQPTDSKQTEFPWMSSAEASPARTLALQEKAQELKAAAPVYGLTTPELLAKFDPDTSSWRTSQRCLVEGWTVFSQTWPRSGLMRNGTAYQLPPLVPLTEGTASGLWPTPKTQRGITQAAAQKEMERTNGAAIGDLRVAVHIWPTPTARDYRSGARSAAGLEKRLADSRGWQLNDVVARFPTPTANRRSGLQSHGVNVILGLLNPMWVEWLMGFPAGWTDLSSSEIPSSRKSRKSSGEQS